MAYRAPTMCTCLVVFLVVRRDKSDFEWRLTVEAFERAVVDTPTSAPAQTNAATFFFASGRKISPDIGCFLLCGGGAGIGGCGHSP